MKNETIIKEAEKRGLEWVLENLDIEMPFVEGTAIAFESYGKKDGAGFSIVKPSSFKICYY